MRRLPSAIVCFRDPRAALTVWVALAAASLSVAAWLGGQPGRSRDLTIVQSWLGHWSAAGQSPYPVEELAVDYPPYALVILAPLLWLPDAIAVLVVTVLNVATSVLLVWLLTGWLARESGVGADISTRAAFAAMLLSWGATRVAIWNGQTVALSLAAGILAVSLAHRAPLRSGLAFAVAACKPTLAIAFAVMLMVQGRWRALAVGAGLLATLTAAFALSVGEPVWTTVGEYLQSLGRMYTGDSFVRGVTSLRAVFIDASNGHWLGDAAFATYGVITCLALVIVLWRVRDRADLGALCASACLLWTLVALPNQRYYLLLVAPSIWLMLFRPDLIARAGARWPAWLAAGLILFNVIDGPMTLRLFAEWVLDRRPDWHRLTYALFWSAYVVIAPVILGLYVQTLRRLWGLR